ncbi:MAG: WbqC family protein [Candidatus Omnitrophica bacterium]|nr:WbqC family protein [Candidatus Omnitrophota bacterium]
MICAIHQPQYLPWLGYFDKIRQADVFILLDNVQFKKNDWQNRNKIRTSQGWQWLTVPVFHNFGQKITEVKINNIKNWRQTHLKALILNYSKAPYCSEYRDFFETVYGQEWEYLVDINIYCIERLVEFLGIKTKIVRASAYQATDDSTQRLMDLCRAVGADTYLSGIDGPKYMDIKKFKESGISLVTQQFVHPVYQQMWSHKQGGEFISHMSIVDVLFNYGRKAHEIFSLSADNVKI